MAGSKKAPKPTVAHDIKAEGNAEFAIYDGNRGKHLIIPGFGELDANVPTKITKDQAPILRKIAGVDVVSELPITEKPAEKPAPLPENKEE